MAGFFYSCTTDSLEGTWDYSISFSPDEEAYGTMKLEREGNSYTGSLVSYEMGNMKLTNI
jgi:hypothetical protein